MINKVFWGKAGQAIKNSKQSFYSNHFFHFHKISNISRTASQNKNSKNLHLRSNLRQTIKIQKFYIYSTKLCFSFSRRFLYCSRPYWRFFSFSSSEGLLYRAYEHIGPFCLFLFQKDFGTFHMLLFEAFPFFW